MSSLDTQGAHQRPGDNAYARAASHSARVRRLKWLLPLIATCVLVGLAGIMAISRLLLSGVDVDLIGTRIVDGQLVIAAPVLNGFTDDDRAYSIGAENARQVIGESMVALETISAEVELEGGRQAQLRAFSGRFDPETNLLHIDDAGTLEISDGTRATFSGVEVDVATGSLQTDQTVTITRPGSEIVADRMIVQDGGRRLVFERDVSVVLQPSAMQSPDLPQ